MCARARRAAGSCCFSPSTWTDAKHAGAAMVTVVKRLVEELRVRKSDTIGKYAYIYIHTYTLVFFCGGTAVIDWAERL